MLKTITAVLLMFMCTNLYAMPIDTTPIGTAYNDGWWYPSGSTSIGPGNKGGTAFGFNLSEGYRVSVLNGFILGVGDAGTFGNAQMSLHRGSIAGRNNWGPLPSDDIIYQSDRFSVPLDGQVSEHARNVELDLEAGDYWLAFQGGHPNGYMKAEGFALDGTELAQVHNPEPMSLLLLGGGLLGAFRLRRKAV